MQICIRIPRMAAYSERNSFCIIVWERCNSLDSALHSLISVKGDPYLTLKVLVTTIDAQWEGMGDEGSARYEPALLPAYPTIMVLSYSN